jgi:hypothetical protein
VRDRLSSPPLSGMREMGFLLRKSGRLGATCSPPPCGEEMEVGCFL